jgi:hypothetical protein
MLKTSWPVYVSRVAALAMLMVVLPACSASAGHKWPWSRRDPASGNVVYRPIYSGLRTKKPLYLNNYAGVVYPPVGSGRAVNPTSAWVTGRRPLRERLFGH